MKTVGLDNLETDGRSDLCKAAGDTDLNSSGYCQEGNESA